MRLTVASASSCARHSPVGGRNCRQSVTGSVFIIRRGSPSIAVMSVDSVLLAPAALAGPLTGPLTPVHAADHIPGWWRSAVIYQVYPRSFRDLNGDGIGDLAGITAELPRLAELDIDAVWLSPFYRSPQRDAGY